MLKIMMRYLWLGLCVAILPRLAAAYEIPRQDAKAQYFYIFGTEGNPLEGKEGDELNFYLDIPEDAPDQIVIRVNDPDTGGKWDQGYAPWDTVIEFSVTGEAQLDKKSFGADPAYDGKSYQFGPYNKTQGQKVGGYYRFTLKAKALQGNDLNLFNVEVLPNYVEASTDKFTFVLLPNTGDKMFFYPEIPAGARKLTVRNYDLDKDGGASHVKDSVSGKIYPVADSESGEWKETSLEVVEGPSRRLEYKVTTLNQDNGHAGIQILDDQGNPVPIYFRKHRKQVPAAPAPKAPKPAPKAAEPKPEPAPAPAGTCNRFVFDGRSSFDKNGDKLKYEWNFGDGTSSSDAMVNHVFAKGGTYEVTLRVTDSSGLECDSGLTKQTVTVNEPPKAAFAGPELTCAESAVTFDASATQDDQPANLKYYWSFGDGTRAEGASVTKAYSKGGVYDVVLTVDDGSGTACARDAVHRTIRVNTAPVADAGKDVTLYLRDSREPYRVVFDGSRSYDPDRDHVTYAWDFGDGSQGEGVRTEHVYERPGQYAVKLQVNDQSGTGCASDVASVNVLLNKAPVSIAGKPQAACSGNTLTFDGSASQGEEGENLQYLWNFGDGETATGVTAEHAYKQGGKYQVTLTVNDGRETPVSQSVSGTQVFINSAPRAVLGEVGKTCVRNNVTFDASGSGDPDGDSLKYTWDFGDGTVVEGKARMSHAYAKGGNYAVRVTVDDGKGGACSTSSAAVNVSVNAPPTANAGPNLTCCQDQASVFDASASSDPDGDSLTYRWDFGDGETGTEAKVNHAYSESGQYRVAVTVDDGSGTACSASSAGFLASVNARPVPVIKIKAE